MSDCPVCVFHATNVSRDTLKGFKCHNCGRDLSEHDLQAKAKLAPSQAFAVNMDHLHTWPA